MAYVTEVDDGVCNGGGSNRMMAYLTEVDDGVSNGGG